MKITREEDYAITLINALSRNYGRQDFVPLTAIAGLYGLPELFLKKIANKLKSADLLAVKEGRGGGYRLARPPQKITVGEVLRVFNRQPFLTTCMDKNHQISCSIYQLCKSRKTWERISQTFYQSLGKINFMDIQGV